MKTFGETLRSALDDRGMKPVDLWRDSEVLSQQYISKLLTGRVADPTFDKACAIVDALGLTTDEFRAMQLED